MSNSKCPDIILPQSIKEVPKGWGKELWIHNDEQYCGKILEIKMDHCFSMHFHKLKTETWYVLSGELKFEWIDFEKGEKHQTLLISGTSVHIPSGLAHQLTACHGDARIMEVSTKHSDSDSYRIAKGD